MRMKPYSSSSIVQPAYNLHASVWPARSWSESPARPARRTSSPRCLFSSAVRTASASAHRDLRQPLPYQVVLEVVQRALHQLDLDISQHILMKLDLGLNGRQLRS